MFLVYYCGGTHHTARWSHEHQLVALFLMPEVVEVPGVGWVTLNPLTLLTIEAFGTIFGEAFGRDLLFVGKDPPQKAIFFCKCLVACAHSPKTYHGTTPSLPKKETDLPTSQRCRLIGRAYTYFHQPLPAHETNSSHLNMDGWKTIYIYFPFGDGQFSGVMWVSGSVLHPCNLHYRSLEA